MKILFVFIAIIFLCCSTGKKDDEKKKNIKKKRTATKDGIVTSRYANGKPRAEITFKDGKRSGLSKSYDRNGDILLELPYIDDKRNGQSKKYYGGGKQLFQTTEYKDDRMHGLQIKYRHDGKVMSEARYENDFPCVGLKQYLTDNTLKKSYPKIVFTPIDQLETQGVYTLKVSMSEKIKAVKYYTGKLSPSGCLSDNLYYILQDQKSKTGELKYNLPPGGFMMEEVNVIAAVETLQGNTYVTQRVFNLAIDN